ncbi:MAG: STAS domain-containing protein [Rhodocyclales bacterium]|nr:STAS domain-containing protein [Rhodocyclales bacterium]
MGEQHIAIDGDTGRISLPNRFDILSSGKFRVPFVRLLANAQARKLVVDFSRLDYIDSMGIGTLISWERTCRDKGKALILDKCNAKVVKAFRQTGVERMFVFARTAA